MLECNERKKEHKNVDGNCWVLKHFLQPLLRVWSLIWATQKSKNGLLQASIWGNSQKNESKSVASRFSIPVIKSLWKATHPTDREFHNTFPPNPSCWNSSKNEVKTFWIFLFSRNPEFSQTGFVALKKVGKWVPRCSCARICSKIEARGFKFSHFRLEGCRIDLTLNR